MLNSHIVGRGFAASFYDDDRFMAWVHDVTNMDACELVDGAPASTLQIQNASGSVTIFLPSRVAQAMADAFNKAMTEE